MQQSVLRAAASEPAIAVGAASPTRPSPLVATLLLRACVSGAFAAWLLVRGAAWIDIFGAGSTYALADGALGLVTVLLLGRHKPITVPPLLVAMVLVDAVLRLAAGAAIRMFPGIPHFPITIVLFFGALGAWAAIAGVIAMVAWFVAHDREKDPSRRARSPAHALFDPLAAAGLIALLLSVYAFVVGPPATAAALRVAAGTASGALAFVFLIAAFGVTRRRRPRSGDLVATVRQ